MKKLSILFGASALFFASCVSNPEGEKAETTDAIEVTAEAEHSLVVDTAASNLEWKGHKVTGEHHGEVNISSGTILVDADGSFKGGNFSIDMTSITVLDLEGDSKAKLTGHLKSDDFFFVETYPVATFEITGVKDSETNGTVEVSGNLTLRGVTKNITFGASVNESTLERFTAVADFNIAREDFGVSYTGKADDLISKEINIKINLTAVK